MDKILFGGFYTTGGSAIGDLLEGFDGIFRFPVEFRLVKEYKGLLDLEKNLSTGDMERIDLAIKDFEWLASNFDRGTNSLRNGGLDYGKHTKFNFDRLTREFIESLVAYEYPMDWYYFDFYRSFLVQAFNKFKLKGFNISTNTKAHMSILSNEDYRSNARKYLDKIFAASSGSKKFKYVSLQNAVGITSFPYFESCMKYFDGAKCIIVDRDPRDVYLSIYENRYLPDNHSEDERVKHFIDFYRVLRSDLDSLKQRDDVIYIRFEDLVINTRTETKRICEFLNLDFSDFKLSRSKFNPSISVQNIKLWESTKDKESIDIISRELKEYCYAYD